MTSPIQRMIDEAVRCCKCGKGRQECRCYIRLVCPGHNCTAVVEFAERAEYDPPEAVELHAFCPKCSAGGKCETVWYYDTAGREIG